METIHRDPRLQSIASAQPYPLIFATVSGAHLYGFPSPNSDVDLRGVHVLPAAEALGLQAKRDTIEAMADPALPDQPSAKAALSDLLVRTRLGRG